METDDRIAKIKAMRALSDDDRRDAIEASPNVIGFERFAQAAKQVALRDAYRKPQKPDGGPRTA